MFVFQTPLALLTKTVIADLALRSGSPTANSCSCFRGMRAFAVGEINRLITEEALGTLTLDAIIASMPDFDADKIQPTCKSTEDDEAFEAALEEAEMDYPYSPYTHDETFDHYYRRLEDIHPRYLLKYMGEALYAAAKYRDGIVRDTQNEYAVQHTLVDQESGKAISESDIELDVNEAEWSQKEIADAIHNLPYVMKRLHNLGILFRVHMLSFIAAYVRADNINRVRRTAGYTKTTKVNDVVDMGVYLCDSLGNATYQPTKSAKNLRIMEVFKWYTYDSDKYPAYHIDVENFLHYVDVLNIDIVNEDMSRYDADFMSKLIVTTITPASQYNPEVYVVLAGRGSLDKKPLPADRLAYTISLFSELCAVVPELKMRVGRTQTKLQKANVKNWSITMATVYYASKGIHTLYGQYRFEDGFLTYNGTTCIIGTEVFMESKQVSDCNACIISDVGYIIGINTSMTLYGISVEDAYANYNLEAVGLSKQSVPWITWRG